MSEATCRIIIFKEQVILIISSLNGLRNVKKNLHFNSSFQISTFKATFENESAVNLSLGVVQLIEWLKFVIITVDFRTVSLLIEFTLDRSIVRAGDVKVGLINSYWLL